MLFLFVYTSFMSNLHRIQWIDKHIRARRYPNCQTIAEEFCISRRQASRDIEYLRYSLNGPVEYSAEHNGYYYTDETYHLPSLLISRQDKEMLSFLADQYKHHGSELAARLADLFARLSGGGESRGVKETALPVYPVNKKMMHILRSIENAQKQKKKIKIDYISSGNSCTCRVVHPYLLFVQSQKQYCAGYCEMRKEERVFRVSRIKKIRVLKEDFLIPSHFDPGKYRKHYRFNARLSYQADVVFHNPVNPAIFTLPYKQTGTCEYCFSFHNSRKLISLLVATGTTFRINSPRWMKDKLREYFASIMESNREE
jgi:predicted DNA-binding transcriptional regulator YafY